MEIVPEIRPVAFLPDHPRRGVDEVGDAGTDQASVLGHVPRRLAGTAMT